MSRICQVSVADGALAGGVAETPATVCGQVMTVTACIPWGLPPQPLAGAVTFLKGSLPEGTARLNAIYATTLTASVWSADGYLIQSDDRPDLAPSALRRR
jgi:hypothetical protein